MYIMIKKLFQEEVVRLPLPWATASLLKCLDYWCPLDINCWTPFCQVGLFMTPLLLRCCALTT